VTRRWGRDPVRTGLVPAVEDAARQATATSTAPGLAVALIHHGQQVWAGGYGLADPATGRPVTAATRFQAASLSKPVTAWGVLRLVETGQIGLDEPVVGRLRRWRPPPSPFDADGITVRRLLSHTAGLLVHGYVGQPSDRPLPPIAASLSGETGDGFPVEPLEAPGRGWLYSGGGYSLLQLLIEELTGRPFADYMQTGVLGPAVVRLGLTAAPATDGRWGLGYGLGYLPSGDRLAYHEGANRGWRAGLALLPDRRAGIVVLANGDDGSRPDRRRGPAVAGPRHAEPDPRAASRRDARHPGRRGRRRARAGQETPNTEEARRPPATLSAFATATWWCRGGPRGRGEVRLGWCRGGRPGSPRRPG
jgi:CubicO group peptidase (beta-lactamase class C family)